MQKKKPQIHIPHSYNLADADGSIKLFKPHIDLKNLTKWHVPAKNANRKMKGLYFSFFGELIPIFIDEKVVKKGYLV